MISLVISIVTLITVIFVMSFFWYKIVVPFFDEHTELKQDTYKLQLGIVTLARQIDGLYSKITEFKDVCEKCPMQDQCLSIRQHRMNKFTVAMVQFRDKSVSDLGYICSELNNQCYILSKKFLTQTNVDIKTLNPDDLDYIAEYQDFYKMWFGKCNAFPNMSSCGASHTEALTRIKEIVKNTINYAKESDQIQQ